jgi:hypothetical protein
MTTRRDFLRCLLGAGALAGLEGPSAFAARRVVSFGLLLSPGSAAGRGAILGMEEARRAFLTSRSSPLPSPT